jgi:hypothetical protein
MAVRRPATVPAEHLFRNLRLHRKDGAGLANIAIRNFFIL